MAIDLTQGAPAGAAPMEAREDGVRDLFVEDADGRVGLFREQDVDGILALNHAERMEDKFQGFRLPPVFRKVASIPVAVVDIAKKYGLDIMNNPDDLRKFLNDAANKAFRTTNEHV